MGVIAFVVTTRTKENTVGPEGVTDFVEEVFMREN
jgi:hypothetical protein